MSQPQKPAPHVSVTRADFGAEGVGCGPSRAGMGLGGGRFVLLELIGEGGNGTVWKARDRELRSSVAVKLLRSTEPDRQRRFSREAEVLANIGHPGVARSLARGITHEGQPFMALELCRGQSLAARLSSGPLPWRDAVQIGIQVAAALDALHARGVIHRDVKPGNLMLWNDDGGLAEFQDSCRLVIQARFALDFEDPLSYSGLRQTTRTGCQLRVFPDQRSG
jgi:hypothetical protein